MRLESLKIRGASVRPGQEAILSDVDFDWSAGQRVAVVGANGAGKSTFLRLVCGDAPLAQGPGGREIGRREYVLSGTPSNGPILARRRMGLAFTSERVRLSGLEFDGSVLDYVAGGLTGNLWPDYADPGPARDKARHWLTAFGIEGLASRPFVALSQGQAASVLLARAMMPDPDLLLLDEPADGLDDRGRGLFFASLAAACAGGAGFLLTTHRQSEWPDVDRAVAVSGGRVRDFNGACAETFGARVVCPADLRLGRELPRPGEVMAELSDVKAVMDGVEALKGVSLTMRYGEHWALLGANGAGKSTLLRLLHGEIWPYGGHGLCGGWLFAHRGRPGEARRPVSFLDWRLESSFDAEAAVWQVAGSGFTGGTGLDKTFTRDLKEKSLDLLHDFGLSGLAHKRFGTVSSGKRRLLLLARAFARRPVLLLADEPMGHLDAGSRAVAGDMLGAMARAGTMLVLTAHHPKDVPACVDHVLHLKDGRADQA